MLIFKVKLQVLVKVKIKPMKNNILFTCFLISKLFTSIVYAQQKVAYDLPRLLRSNKLSINPGQSVTILNDGNKHGISCNGIVWLKNVQFSTGTIDLDVRGKDVFQQSFLGIAFHGIDTLTYDAIYFRPFNFQSSDNLRQKHTIQYVSEPDQPWDKLRQEHPLTYENRVIPIPLATGWFHAHIVINNDEIITYVDYSTRPSLKVKKLNSRQNGLIGLWTFGLKGDFANLIINNY